MIEAVYLETRDLSELWIEKVGEGMVPANQSRASPIWLFLKRLRR